MLALSPPSMNPFANILDPPMWPTLCLYMVVSWPRSFANILDPPMWPTLCLYMVVSWPRYNYVHHALENALLMIITLVVYTATPSYTVRIDRSAQCHCSSLHAGSSPHHSSSSSVLEVPCTGPHHSILYNLH